METRRLGRTGQDSTIITFGAYAIGNLTQDNADRAIEFALGHGVNHFDVAPTYADAELRLGDYLRRHPRPDLFISCKTTERSKEGASFELHRTLDRLHRDRFDLYQYHAVCTDKDLEDVLAPGGAGEAVQDARNEGLVTYVGITGHGMDAPRVHASAVDRLDLSTVMTACNPYLGTIPDFRRDWEALMRIAVDKHLGVLDLKAGALCPWGDRAPTSNTWYEPLTDQDAINRSVAWVLRTWPVTTLCSSGDVAIMKMMVEATREYQSLPELSADEIVARTPDYANIFDAA